MVSEICIIHLMKESVNNPVIRFATLEDLAAINALADQLGYPNSLEAMRSRLEVILSRKDQAIFVASQPGLSVFGYIHVLEKTSLEVGHVAEIGGLVVDKEFRRQGLGKALLRAAEMWAQEKDCVLIRLHSNIIREGAHRFYQDLGYAITKTQYAFSKSLKE